MKYYLILLTAFLFSCAKPGEDIEKPSVETIPGVKQKNIVFILSDDHRYDFMGFMGTTDFLETPSMDKMAREGIHFKNTFVTTSLCSPSRASILTGQFSHHHGVVDNQSLIADSVTFFPQYLQEVGYQTAFIGKWHMGEYTSQKRKGFDRWISFKGQGEYYNPLINVDGADKQFTDSAYVTDVLTDYAVDFIKNRDKNKPFFLYLSHKGVHAHFMPAKRHMGKYKDAKLTYPPTFYPPNDSNTAYNYKDLPDWVKKQRYSWHGVDYLYHGSISFDDFVRRYAETLLSVDESIGTVLKTLDEDGLLENTVVMYMGDNGFSFGEHGLIDKRQAYEESMRVPLLMYGAGIDEGREIDQLVQNVDIAPTILEYAGVHKPRNMDGESFVPLIENKNIPWKDKIFYEYYWERAYPQTPSMHAVRTDKYKFIRYYGIWDINELYDMENDPHEMNNLIRNPEYQELCKELDKEIFDWLSRTNGMYIPLRADQGPKFDYRYKETY